MDPKKKGGLMLAIELGKKKGDEEEKAPASERGEGSKSENEAFEEAAGELFDALKADDREAFSEALQAAIYACQE